MNVEIRVETLKRFLSVARAWLEVRREILNNLNIFPIPDGDTGSNMLNTVGSALAAFEGHEGSVADIFAAIVQKGLLGARGNSGIILANFMKGVLGELASSGRDVFTRDEIVSALNAGRDQAYRGTLDPVEGTILTVISETVTKADDLLSEGVFVTGFFSELSEHGRNAVERTRDQLDILKAVGVVDSGACGFYYMIEAFARDLKGLKTDESARREGYVPDAGDGLSAEWEARPDTKYCLDITLRASDRTEHLLESLQEYGTAEVAISAGELMKVHLHTNEPDSVVRYVEEISDVLDVHKENMITQQYRMMANRKESLDGLLGVTAVVSGDGMKEIYREIGADAIIDGGETMNPSVEEMVRGIEDAGKKNVVLLINNRDVLLSGREASKLTDKAVGIVRTGSMTEGIAGLMNFSPGVPIRENVELMERGLSSVPNGYITRAVRSTSSVEKGDYFSGREREIFRRGTLEDVFRGTLERHLEACGELSLLTVYTGKDVADEDVEIIRKTHASSFPDMEIEILFGGQPNYLFLYSVE